VLESPPTDTDYQKNTIKKGPKKCIDGNMVTLITTVQQITTGLQAAHTEKNKYALIMRAVYGLVM